MFPYCNLKGIGILAYSPLMDGYLARPVGAETERTQTFAGTFLEKKRRNSDNEIIKRVQAIAEKRSWKMSQVALAWSATKVSSPIVGLSKVRDSLFYRSTRGGLASPLGLAGGKGPGVHHRGWDVKHGGNPVSGGAVSTLSASNYYKDRSLLLQVRAPALQILSCILCVIR